MAFKRDLLEQELNTGKMSSEWAIEELRRLGGPKEVFSRSWDLCYPPKYVLGGEKFDSLEEAEAWAQAEIEKVIQRRDDFHTSWRCEKCDTLNLHFSEGVVTFHHAEHYYPRYEKQGPLPESDRYNRDGYFTAAYSSERLVWKCQCGNKKTTKTKEQTHGQSVHQPK